MSHKHKTLYCKTATIIGPPHVSQKNLNVADIIRECHDIEAMQRRIPISLLEYMSSHSCTEQDNGLLIHLVKATEGSDASIVPTPRPQQKNVELETIAPPHSGDYLEEECFAYFFGNHVITLSNGVSNASLGKYLTALAKAKNFIGEEQEIRISNMINKDALKKIRTHGVRHMTVKANLNIPTWKAATPEATAFKKAVRGLLRQDTEQDRDDIDNYHYNLTITAKGKAKAEKFDPLTQKGAHLFDELENEDARDTHVEIMLRNKEKITLKETTLYRDVSIKRLAMSLDKKRILQEVIQYKNDLIENASIDG